MAAKCKGKRVDDAVLILLQENGKVLVINREILHVSLRLVDHLAVAVSMLALENLK